MLQIVFAGPSGAINALQHFVAVVTAPVSASDFHQLEVLELAGAWYVRATAEIFKCTFAVQANVFVGRNTGNDLCLVVLAHIFEIGDRVITRQNAPHHGLVFVGEFGHALFDGDQVFRRETAAERKIIEKAVFDHRTDGDLRLRKQFFGGIGQQMRGGMADNF